MKVEWSTLKSGGEGNW